MRLKYIFICYLLISLSTHLQAQTIAQLKADKAFNLYNYSEALIRYTKIAEKGYPKTDSNHVNLHIGDCYKMKGNPKKAAEWYSKSIHSEIEPKYYLYYATALKQNGEYEKYNHWIAKYNIMAKTDILHLQPITENDLDEFQKMASRYDIEPMNFNTKYSDYSPAFFGDSILFVSSRDSSKAKSGWTGEFYYSIFMGYMDSTDDYNLTKRLPYFGTKYHEGPMSYYAPDSLLYFTRSNTKMDKRDKI